MRKLDELVRLGNSVLLLLVSSVFGNIIDVPNDYSTIQEGINATIDGDTVYVHQGTYIENIYFNGKNIVVMGEDRATTIIDGNQNSSVAIFNSGENSATLIGFTLTNGMSSSGGGVSCTSVDIVLKDLIITENNTSSSSYNSGGGLYINNSTVIIENVIISNNINTNANAYGGGIWSESSILNLFNVEINNNVSHYGGGGVDLRNSTLIGKNILLSNNTMTSPSQQSSGILIEWNSSAYFDQFTSYNNNLWISDAIEVSINNSIIWNSTLGGSSYNVTYSNVQGGFGGTGNINSDPIFVDVNNDDFNLQWGSPCINTGNPDSDGDGISYETDIDDQDPDGTRLDMGAFPFTYGAADFTAEPVGGLVPLDVVFTDLSYTNNGEIYSWEWDFNNDGIIDSYDQNPLWTFSISGQYTVALKISALFDGENWVHTIVKENYITAVDLFSWNLRLQSSINDAFDNDNFIGVSEGATNEYDVGVDQVEPPLPPNNYVAVYIPHPEWEYPLGDNFAQDIRPEIILIDTMQVWPFDVESDLEGDVTLTFDFTDVPDVPVILEDEQTQLHWEINDGDTYTFTYSGSAHQFNIAIGDTTPPTIDLLYPTGLDIFQSDSTLTLLWDAQDSYQLDSVLAFYSIDGGNAYTSIEDFGDVDQGDWVIPNWYYENDLFFKLIGEDHAGNTAEVFSDYACIASGDSLSIDITAGWSLWGAPFSPYETNMETNLEDDLTDWVTYDYLNGGYTFDGVLNLGAGYWLGTTNDGLLDIQGEIAPNPQSFNISAGWNLISNPLVVDIPRENLLFSNGVETYGWEDALLSGWIEDILFTSDGNGYVDSDTLKYWKAYWLGALEDLAVEFDNFPTTFGPLSSNRDGWYIQFNALDLNGNFDNTNLIGQEPDASDDYDIGVDAIKPPPPPFDAVRLFLLHPEWGHLLGDEFSKDIRSEVFDDDITTWQFTGESSSEITLFWTLENLPAGINVGLFTSLGFVDMRENSEYTFLIDEFSNFEVRASFSSLGIDDNHIIPLEFTLKQNFPNPFNPITTIAYQIPKAGKVNISIYNIKGELIKTMVNEAKTPGSYSVNWLSSDYSSGIYFYKLTAGNKTFTKKMLLLK